MYLNELELRYFRNYQQQRLEFDPGVNLIVGSNAQGKTNLLEAVSFLGSGKSFRAQKTGEMIGFSQDFGASAIPRIGIRPYGGFFFQGEGPGSCGSTALKSAARES